MPVKLLTSDEVAFDVDLEIFRQFAMISGSFDEDGLEALEDDEPIPLHCVNAAIFTKVLQWCKYHKDDAPQQDDDVNKERRADNISSWDQEFLRVDQETLFELTRAADCLGIKGLLDTCCKYVANMIKGKTPEEIRKTLNVKSHFVPEEEEQVCNENEWCEEK